jgi:hypothetical protein
MRRPSPHTGCCRPGARARRLVRHKPLVELADIVIPERTTWPPGASRSTTRRSNCAPRSATPTGSFVYASRWSGWAPPA